MLDQEDIAAALRRAFRAACVGGTIFLTAGTAVSDFWTIVSFTPGIVAITETMFCAKQTALLIRRKRFQVSWKIVTGLSTIVSGSPAIDSDTCRTVCVLSPAF